MTTASNPQEKEMAHESMVRTLAAQATAIWPQERALFTRYALPERPRVVDVGCGTGELLLRLAELLPSAELVGVDLIEPHLELARAATAHLGDRVALRLGNAFALPFPDGSFDLSVCRHMLQAVPTPERVIAELMRVTRSGGRLHLIAEDYGMIHQHPGGAAAARFWLDVGAAFGDAMGVDMFVGRRAVSLLRAAGAREIAVDYVVVDPLRAPREVVASIFEAWRDGFAESIAAHTTHSLAAARAHFDAMSACARDPERYLVWQVPVLSALAP